MDCTLSNGLNMITSKYLVTLAAEAHLRVYAFNSLTDGRYYLHFQRIDDDSAALTVPIEFNTIDPSVESLITAFHTGITLLGGAPRV